MSMYVLKTIVAGEGGIGKSTIVKRFMNEVLSRDYKMTIGMDVFSKNSFLVNRLDHLYFLYSLCLF